MSHPILPFPNKPGVRYRHVPGHMKYIASDDGKVYMSSRTHWREMKLHTVNGKRVVWLMNNNNTGGEDIPVDELVQQIFGGG